MIHRLSLFAGILALLTGCAAPQVPLTQRAQANIESAESVLLIPQGALNVIVNPTYLGGGLLPALLASYADSKRQASATVAASPVTQKVQDYDFRAAMREAWTGELAKVSNMKFKIPVQVETFELESPESKAQKKADYDQSDAAAVMFAAIEYSLRSGTLVITARVEMYPKVRALLPFRHSPNESDPLDEGNVIYRKTFTHEKEFITPNNVRRGLDEGVLNIARKIAADLEHPLP